MNQTTKRRLTVRGFLSIFVVFTIVRQGFMHNHEGVFMGVLTLLLFCIPTFIERKTGIDLPPVLEGIIYCFIFKALILKGFAFFIFRDDFISNINLTGYNVKHNSVP